MIKILPGYRPSEEVERPLPPILERFGLRSANQVGRDLQYLVRTALNSSRYGFDIASAGLLRPDLSFPAYAGWVPEDGRAPIYNLFDQTTPGTYCTRVSRNRARDFRGLRLSYDDHGGTDFVCPIGTPLVAVADGVAVMLRDRWLRGGLTLAIDHGGGLVSQYTHLWRATVSLGQTVKRGEKIALSGVSGFDLFQFCPWVPPHLHFSVWYRGRPVDPFAAFAASDADADAQGVLCGWRDGHATEIADNGFSPPDTLGDEEFDLEQMADLVAACQDRTIQAELEAVATTPRHQAALLEDALHHDCFAWPEAYRQRSIRREPSHERDEIKLELSLPLSPQIYQGFRFADTPWTRTAA